MNDLVKRLRYAGNDSMNHDCMYTPELIEAADEIERGYAENSRYREALKDIIDGNNDDCSDCIYNEGTAEKALERVSTEQTPVCPETAIEARDEKGQTHD